MMMFTTIVIVLFLSCIHGSSGTELDDDGVQRLIVEQLGTRHCPLDKCDTRTIHSIEILERSDTNDMFNMSYHVQVRRMVRGMTSDGEIVTVPAYVSELREKRIRVDSIVKVVFRVGVDDTFEASSDGQVDQAYARGEATVRCDAQDECAVTALMWSSMEMTCVCNGKNDLVKGDLHFLSVNLWNYNHWTQRLPLLKEELLRLKPHVIGFQEVRALKLSQKRTHRFQISDLAEMLPEYQYVFEPAMTFKEGDNEVHSEGLALFTTLPIVNVKSLLLSRDPSDGNDFHQRKCLHAQVLTGDDTELHVMTTHLSLSRKARERSTDEIGLYSNELRGAIALMGDFNAVAHEHSVKKLVKKYKFVDSWDVVHSDSTTTNGYTFNSWDMSKRIDLILLRNMVATSASVQGSNFVHSQLPPVGGVADMKNRLYPSGKL